MRYYKLQFTRLAGRQANCKLAVILILASFLIGSGCQKVEKPVRDGTGPLAIIIEVDEAPESHIANVTSEGEALKTPYSSIPVLGTLFKSSLSGLDYWKANHPNLITGTDNPALAADPEETCLDCHDISTSCNNCHSYVGVKLVTGEE
jgi:hypothetical protein